MAVLRDEDVRARDPERLGGILRDLIERLAPSRPLNPAPGPGGASDVGASLEQISVLWESAVGRELARWTRVIRFRGGTLLVEVSSAPLLAELRGFAGSELVQELVSGGLTGLHGIRFRAGSNGHSGGDGQAGSSVPGDEGHGAEAEQA